jgi:hypothetical protein
VKAKKSGWLGSGWGALCLEKQNAKLSPGPLGAPNKCPASGQVGFPGDSNWPPLPLGVQQDAQACEEHHNLWCIEHGQIAKFEYDCDGDGVFDKTCEGPEIGFSGVLETTLGAGCNKGPNYWSFGALSEKCPAVKQVEADKCKSLGSPEVLTNSSLCPHYYISSSVYQSSFYQSSFYQSSFYQSAFISSIPFKPNHTLLKTIPF